MKRVIVVLALVLFCLGLAPSPAWAGDAPSFSWGAGMSVSVRIALKQAEAKWNAAEAVPVSPKSLRSTGSKAFDEAYLREVLDHKDFAYDLLDASITKLQRIEECRSLYEKAVSAAGSCAPAAAAGFDPPFYSLKSRIRLAIGLSRAVISREMAAPESSGYCFEAMESAIDALRDAAADADKSLGGSARAQRIRDFRAALFSTWEAAQRAKDTKFIAGIDLAKAWDDSGLAKRANTK